MFQKWNVGIISLAKPCKLVNDIKVCKNAGDTSYSVTIILVAYRMNKHSTNQQRFE